MENKIFTYDKLPIIWKIVCYQRARKIGFVGKEIKNLRFQFKNNQLVGILDNTTLANIFYI